VSTNPGSAPRCPGQDRSPLRDLIEAASEGRRVELTARTVR
jgi:hypothetical protein